MNASNRPILLSTCILISISIGTAQMSIAAPWTIQQITHNDVNDRYPQSSGPDIVWQRHDGNDWEIIQYQSGVELPPITSNSVNDRYPTVAGGNIIWQQHDGNDDELVVYNGTTSQQWTDNGRNDQYPHASGNIIAWERYDNNDTEIFFDDISDGPGETQVTDNTVSDSDPRVTGDRIVWEGLAGPNLATDWEVFLYNISTAGTTRLTNNSVNDLNPDTSDTSAAWQRSDVDTEIILLDGVETSVTDDTLFDVNAVVSSTLLIWRHWDGNDYEIMMLKDGLIHQVTDNDFEDGQADLDGDTIVWEGWDGNDYEIFTTTIPTILIPEPSTLILTLAGFAALLSRRRR